MDKNNKIGVWLIGALGSISATVIAGALALGKKCIEPTGMVTETRHFEGLDLPEVASFVFGGWDIRNSELWPTVHNILTTCGVQDESFETVVQKIQTQIQPGTASNCGTGIAALVGTDDQNHPPLAKQLENCRRNLQNFRKDNNLAELIVINLASTEPAIQLSSAHSNPEALAACIENNDYTTIRASTIYAYAAILEGCPYINFTPSNAALIPALITLSKSLGVPIAGSDGKTGETLVKSALAPMFASRNLDVLSWEGHNLLGNMDGRILNNPENCQSKIKTKEKVLAKILGYAPHSQTHINFVPSLGDQKTAWDFIHFQGFLGTRMSLQFTWQGYDSMLAAPLVLDLVRMMVLANQRGEKGPLTHLASFFKDPLECDIYDHHGQFSLLMDYVGHVKRQQNS